MMNADNIKFIKKLLETNDYSTVVVTVAQLWGMSPQAAEKQMNEAGFVRAKYAKKKTTTEKKLETTKTDEPAQPALEKKKRRPSNPIRWTTELEERVLDMWDAGVPAKEIASSIKTTEDTVRSRIKLLVARRRQRAQAQRAQPSQQQQPSRPSSRPKSRTAIRGITRDLVEDYLSNFGLVGRHLIRKMRDDSRSTPAMNTNKSSAPTKHAEQLLDRLARVAARGAATVIRRIDIMADRVSSALAAAAASARSLTRAAGVDNEEAKRERGAPSTGSTSALGLLGIGIAAGIAGSLLSTQQSSASINPNDDPTKEPQPPTENKEDTLRESAKSDRNDDSRSDVFELVGRAATFKADKIVFDADYITGIDGINSGAANNSGKPAGPGNEGVPPPAVNPPDSSSGGWWDSIKKRFGFGDKATPETNNKINPSGAVPSSGTPDVNSAIEKAVPESGGMSKPGMKAIASIESSLNPQSNANKATQYKGLFQIGKNEWAKYGKGDIYNPGDNAMAAARLFKQNNESFEKQFGRKPAEHESYMMHQQGLGFYTKGVMTNVEGNPYPGMKGPQTRESFENGWKHEFERRRTLFDEQEKTKSTQTLVPEEKPAPSVKEDANEEAINKAKEADPLSSLTIVPETTKNEARGKKAELDVIDPTGPTFGGGKTRVAGLDADLSSPWS